MKTTKKEKQVVKKKKIYPHVNDQAIGALGPSGTFVRPRAPLFSPSVSHPRGG